MNWKIEANEWTLITHIAKRAESYGRTHGWAMDYEYRDALMDLAAVHANGCPLDLAGLYDATPLDFCHDIYGIRRHLDRTTGKLGDCFIPRYAAKTGAKTGVKPA